MSLKFSSSLHWKRAYTGWYCLFHQGNLLIYHYKDTLREKCPYSELFWSVFSRIRTEYGEMRSISPYSVRMRMQTRITPNTDTFYAVIVRTWTRQIRRIRRIQPMRRTRRIRRIQFRLLCYWRFYILLAELPSTYTWLKGEPEPCSMYK